MNHRVVPHFLFASSFLISSVLSWGAPPVDVSIERLPEGAMQPRGAIGPDGAAHLIWLAGDPAACDVFYQVRPPGGARPGAAIRVNTEPGSAIAMGTVRGAQIALGKNGRVHVVWNSSGRTRTADRNTAALLYTRSDAGGSRFEPERSLGAGTAHLDGGGDVAADDAGNVTAVWHAMPAGAEANETARRVFVARSRDQGESFAAAEPIGDPVGACGCCGLSARAAGGGQVAVLFRSAKTKSERDLTLMSSQDGGKTFATAMLSPWATAQCPMSTAALLPAKQMMWAAWETEGKVLLASLPAGSDAAPKPFASFGDRAKNPALATNQRGEILVVWTEGTGWQRGGSIAWQVLDAAGQPIGKGGKQAGLPVWSFAAAYARANGDFVIVF